MKKLFLILIALFIATSAISQTTFTIDDLTYKTIDATSVKITKCSTNVVSVDIPSIVSYEGNDYDVTVIGTETFKRCYELTNINIPESIHAIEEGAFYYCTKLTEINIPSNVTTIARNTFRECNVLTSFTIPNSITSIGEYAFYECDNLTSITIPDSVTYIGNYAFSWCTSLSSITLGSNLNSLGTHIFYKSNNIENVICLSTTPPNIESTTFNESPTTKKLTIPFGSDYSSWETATEWVQVNHKIKAEETISLSNTFEITSANKRAIINEGVLVIEQGGELVNETETNVGGVIEVKTKILPNDKWSFIGAPFNGYKLEAIKPGTHDVSVSVFDYEGEGAGDWSNDWATIETEIGRGEGFFVWSFAQEQTTFTTNGDVGDYSINNDTVIEVTKSLTENEGYWMALANPYPFKLDVSKFIANNANNIQGQNGIYLLDENGAFQYVTDGTINVTEGFFVNFIGSGNNTAVFKKGQRKLNSNKDIAKRDFIQLTMLDGENKSELLFAHNEKAKQEYDIYDANKMFSPMEITEAYFLTEGKALVKEEVESLPYYATLNVKSYESKEVSFRVDNIPEDICVFILDNENDIRMKEGMEYTTNIVAGENEDRFKLLVKKAYRINEKVNHDIFISNYNRVITISSSQKDLKTKIYDALGRKVFETTEYKFKLNELPAGAYMIKVYNKNAYESKKILIN